MRILLLGGVAESRELAQALIDARYDVIYSIMGLVRVPELNCEIHIGGFSTANANGTDGLIEFLKVRQIELVIDATHPYAEQMSVHALNAARHQSIPCWRLTRPGWDQSLYPSWRDYDGIDELVQLLDDYQRPFLSIGASVLRHAHRRVAEQTWVVRTARAHKPMAGITLIEAIGPFDYDDELKLLKDYRIDAVVSKNSGCRRIIHKIDAAHALGLPILVQKRPVLPDADAQFTAQDVLLAALSGNVKANG